MEKAGNIKDLSLAEDLEIRLKGCRSNAQTNDRLAYGLILVGVVTSAAATISVGTDSLTKEMNSILTALPGIAVMALNTFKYEARAKWWWKKHSKFQRYLYALKHEGANENDVSKEMNKFLLAHEDDWPSFGKPPSGVIT